MDFNSLVGKTVKIVGVEGLEGWDEDDELAYTLTFELEKEDGEKLYVEVRSVPIDWGDSSALTLCSRKE